MPDDVSGLDLGDGFAPAGRPGWQGGGKVIDPFERCGLVVCGQGLLAPATRLARVGSAGSVQHGADSGTGQVPQFVFRVGRQAGFARRRGTRR